MSQSIDWRQRFSALAEILAQWQFVWQPLPFKQLPPEWTQQLPQLSQYLLALDDNQWQQLEENIQQAKGLSPWLPVEQLAELVQVPGWSTTLNLPEDWSEHISARKWQQLQAFVAQIRWQPQQQLVDWCAGKGHLCRTLSRWQGCAITALEWDEALCQEGQQLADALGLPVQLQQQDVLADSAARWIKADSHTLALHACGDLHGRLLQLTAAAQASLTLAPCCYQVTAAEHYQPFSALGQQLQQQLNWQLTREDLRLAVQETVTAPGPVRQQRQQASAWRLAFDALQRELRGVDQYWPVPSLSYGQLKQGFSAFVHWCAQRKGLALPAELDWQYWEQLGWQRLAQVQRFELARHLFRRPLELWLVLDRLVFLQEAGLQVELGTFCSKPLTPRNLLIRTIR